MNSRGKPRITTIYKSQNTVLRKEDQTMKKKLSFGMIAIILATAFLLLSTTSVFAGASDTVAGTTINNKAVLTFNGTTILESSPVAGGNSTIGPNQGANTTFVVDRKVRPFVEVEAPGSVNVYAGGTGYVLTFNVMNDGNDDEIFKISLDASTTVR